MQFQVGSRDKTSIFLVSANLIQKWPFSSFRYNIQGGHRSSLDSSAPTILSIYGPGFESQEHHPCLFRFEVKIVKCEKDKNKEKIPGLLILKTEITPSAKPYQHQQDPNNSETSCLVCFVKYISWMLKERKKSNE